MTALSQYPILEFAPARAAEAALRL